MIGKDSNLQTLNSKLHKVQYTATTCQHSKAPLSGMRTQHPVTSTTLYMIRRRVNTTTVYKPKRGLVAQNYGGRLQRMRKMIFATSDTEV